MNKYIIVTLCAITPLLHSMEQQTVPTRKWDAKAYNEGSQLQTTAFLYFIKTNNVNIKNKTILDVGCGTGKGTAYFAQKATCVHGIDAGENQIEYAQEHHSAPNVSFQHCFAENFISQEKYNLALSAFCLHWTNKKKEIFQRINDSLETNGELFATLSTKNNPEPLNFFVFREMLQTNEKLRAMILQSMNLSHSQAQNIKLEDLSPLTTASYASNEELHTMLKETNFELIKCEQQSYDYTMNRDELKKLYWPLLSGLPLMKLIPTDDQEPLFEAFINGIISKSDDKGDGNYESTLHTTVIHARKIEK